VSEAQPHVLLVEDEPAHASLIGEALRRVAGAVEHVATGAEAFALLSARRFDLVVLDIGLPDVSGVTVLRWMRARGDASPVVFVTVEDAIERGVEAMRQGATNYVVKRPGYLEALVAAASEAVARPRPPEARPPTTEAAVIVGASPVIEEVCRLVREYAATDATVVIQGETGTGKELVAGALHRASPRARGPLVPVNCAAIPESLLESELFGHVRGAFTGADRDRAGLLKGAAGGTLFLDEVSELPLGLQAKLLRMLESRAYRPLGASVDVHADVRVIAATNRDLRGLVEQGRFRSDLYYRLDVLWIHLPPLRDRREDIPLLAESFLVRYAPDRRLAMTSGAIAQLMAAPWPGNVRELEHVVQRTVLRCEAGLIARFEMGPGGAEAPPRGKVAREELVALLVRHRGRLGPVAEALRVSVRTVQRHMVEYGLTRRTFRKLGT